MANKWDERKKAQEDEYFVKKERELVAKLKAKQDAEAKESAKKASYMKCPKCGESLKERSFQKITIDQCTGLQRHLARCRRARTGCGKGHNEQLVGKVLAEERLGDKTALLDSGKSVSLRLPLQTIQLIPRRPS